MLPSNNDSSTLLLSNASSPSDLLSGEDPSYPDFCPRFSQEDIHLLDSLAFWIEGVVQTTIAVTGIVFNTISRHAFGNGILKALFFGFSSWKWCFAA